MSKKKEYWGHWNGQNDVAQDWLKYMATNAKKMNLDQQIAECNKVLDSQRNVVSRVNVLDKRCVEKGRTDVAVEAAIRLNKLMAQKEKQLKAEEAARREQKRRKKQGQKDEGVSAGSPKQADEEEPDTAILPAWCRGGAADDDKLKARGGAGAGQSRLEGAADVKVSQFPMGKSLYKTQSVADIANILLGDRSAATAAQQGRDAAARRAAELRAAHPRAVAAAAAASSSGGSWGEAPPAPPPAPPPAAGGAVYVAADGSVHQSWCNGACGGGCRKRAAGVAERRPHAAPAPGAGGDGEESGGEKSCEC